MQGWGQFFRSTKIKEHSVRFSVGGNIEPLWVKFVYFAWESFAPDDFLVILNIVFLFKINILEIFIKLACFLHLTDRVKLFG